MDPKATLLAASDCFDDIEQFCDLMAEYYRWRYRGGFEPTINYWPGDYYYNNLYDKFIGMGGSTNKFYRWSVGVE